MNNIQFLVGFISIACSLISGCVNVEDSIFHTQYEKTNWYNAGGYGDRMIQSDMYQVWFAANQLVKKENVDYFALVRAAEVTLLAGKQYFEVVSGEDVGETIRYATPGLAIASSKLTAKKGLRTSSTAMYIPASEESVTFPKTLLLIRLRDEKTEHAYVANELLLGAKQDGLKLQVEIE